MTAANNTVLPSNKSGIVYGLATGIAMVVYNLVLRTTHVPDASWLNFMVLVIYLVGVLWFCYAFGRNDRNDTSFGGMFKGAFRMVAIVTIVLVAAALINVWLDPNLKKEIMANNLAALKAAKKTQQEINEAMKISNDKFTLTVVMASVFSNIFYGVVFALAGAFCFKRNKA